MSLPNDAAAMPTIAVEGRDELLELTPVSKLATSVVGVKIISDGCIDVENVVLGLMLLV
jgi:hypothetical protein